jgi:hypothetical protein
VIQRRARRVFWISQRGHKASINAGSDTLPRQDSQTCAQCKDYEDDSSRAPLSFVPPVNTYPANRHNQSKHF